MLRAVKLKEQIRIPQSHEHCTLENYRPRTLSQTHALAEAWGFAERYPEVDRGVIFLGRSGVGKTHLAVGIALELVQRFQDDILFMDFQTLPGQSASFETTTFGCDFNLPRLETVSLLVLDSIGARSASGGQYQAALRILGTRMRHRRPTICTSVRLEGVDKTSNSEVDIATGDYSTSRPLLLQVHALLLGSFKIVPVIGSDSRGQGNHLPDLF